MAQQAHAQSLYPLDKNRKLLSETTDADGTVRKVFRLFAEDGDSVDVEFEIHKPHEPGLFKPKLQRHKIVSQHPTEQGHLKSMKIEHESGGVKEYFHRLDHPGESMEMDASNKRKAENQNEDQKKPKTDDKYSVNWAFTELLLKAKVEHLHKTEQGKIFVAYRHELAADVFKGLVQHGFYSCPVLNKKGNLHYGFIDLLDFIHYFIGEIADKELKGPGSDLWTLINKATFFGEKKVKDLMTASPVRFRNPFHPILKGYSLYAAIEALAREKHLHRVPIIDEERHLVNLITQSQVMEFVYQNLNQIGSKKDKPLSHIPSLFHHVERILSDQEVVEAFKIIETKGVSGVALVNAEDKLVGAVSTRDLKGVSVDGKWLSRLFLTGDLYFQEMLKDYPDTKRPSGPVFVTETDTLETAIRKLHENKIHRVFICDAKQRPVGVVGLKEICKELVY